MVRAIHRHCGLGQSVPVTGRLSDSLVRSPFLSRARLIRSVPMVASNLRPVFHW